MKNSQLPIDDKNLEMKIAQTLYVTDLDGTLLGNDHRLSQETIDILNPLLDQGLNLMVATARNFPSASELLAKVKLKTPMILANGALIADTWGNPIWEAAMAPESLQEIYTALEPFANACVWTSLLDGNFLLITPDPTSEVLRFKDYRQATGFSGFKFLEGLDHLIQESIITLTLMVDQVTAQQALSALETADLLEGLRVHVMPYPGLDGLYTMTVQPETTHKGAAISAYLEWLANRQEVTINRIVVFGDERNDLTMFALADVSLAVAQAHPEVKAVASQVIESNDNSGVARWIRRDIYAD